MTRTQRTTLTAAGAILIAGLAVATLVGCEAIPGAGPVQPGLTDLRQSEQTVQFNPLGPAAGASQEDIVRGFVLAGSSNEGDYAVAREFLAPGYAEQWDPSFGVLIDEGERPYTLEKGNAGTMQLSAIAKIDALGQMLPVAPGPKTDVRFEFEEVDGEWRIASAPAGIILDRTTFTAVWSSHQLYFVNAGNMLVPETRWYLSRASIATEMLNGLLDGPGERMAQALHSGFPPGTALATSAVTVVDSRAQIDLTAEVLDASQGAMGEMYGQLRESLKNVPGVLGFDITVDGAPIRDIPQGLEVPTAPILEAENPAILRENRFGVLMHGDFVGIGMFGEAIVRKSPSAVSLAPGEDVAAVLASGGISRITVESDDLVDGRADLLEPSFDRLGYIWTSNRAGELSAYGPTGDTWAVPATWIDGMNAVAVQVSPDGSRLAALANADGKHSVVYVVGIVRDENGVPVRTTDSSDAAMWVAGEAVDLDWVDNTRFATLTRTGTASKVGIGGPGMLVSEQGTVPGGVQISSGGSRSQLRVLADDGELFVAQGSGWQRAIGDVDVLAKRG